MEVVSIVLQLPTFIRSMEDIPLSQRTKFLKDPSKFFLTIQDPDEFSNMEADGIIVRPGTENTIKVVYSQFESKTHA